MRTTVDIDDTILNEVKELQIKEGRSMSAVVSELLADAISRRKRPLPPSKFQWKSKHMNTLVNLADKEEVYAVLDQGNE